MNVPLGVMKGSSPQGYMYGSQGQNKNDEKLLENGAIFLECTWLTSHLKKN